jgi:hypothetical protein
VRLSVRVRRATQADLPALVEPVQRVADRENEAALRFYDRRGWRRTRLVALHHGL